MLHAGGASAFLYCGPRPCAAALERCACRKAAGRACPAPTFYAGERFTPPRGVFRCHRRARSGQDRSLQTTRYRCIAGRDDRLSKKVCSPLGPLCEGAPPAGGGGENCTAARNISGYGKVLSLRPFGAPPSQREVRLSKKCIVGATIGRPRTPAAMASFPGGYGIRPYAVGVDARHRPGRAAAAAGPPLQSEALFRVVM